MTDTVSENHICVVEQIGAEGKPTVYVPIRFKIEKDGVTKTAHNIKTIWDGFIGGGTRDLCYQWFRLHATLRADYTYPHVTKYTKTEPWVGCEPDRIPDAPTTYISDVVFPELRIELHKLYENLIVEGDREVALHVIVLPLGVRLNGGLSARDDVEGLDGQMINIDATSWHEQVTPDPVDVHATALLMDFIAKHNASLEVQETA